MRRALLTTHIAAAVGLVGADLALISLGVSGLTGADPLTVYPAMSLVARSILLPLGGLALVSGIVLGLVGRWGLVRYWWTTIKLAITVGLVTAVGLVVEPGLARAADAARSVAPETVLTQTQQLVYVIAPSVASLMLLINIALGVYKPPPRLRSSGSRDRSPSVVSTRTST